MTEETIQERIAVLKDRIEQLTERLPAHSIKPEMFRQLEQLQEELETLLTAAEKRDPSLRVTQG